MAAKTIYAMRKELRETITSLTDTLVSGGVKDIGEYRYICGKLNGLVTADQLLGEYQTAMEQHNAD